MMPTETVTNTQLAELIKGFQDSIRVIVEEIRKPPVDPIKVIQRKREQETKDASLKEYWAKKLTKLKACRHSRQDGTCVVGWARQSDGIERGYCPNCDNMLGPELATFGEEYLAIYKAQQIRPRGLMEAVRYV